MGNEARTDALIDTCVLINFLRVDRLALLGGHPSLRILITNHVRGEVSNHYPEQIERLNAGLDSGLVVETSVEHQQELDVFAALVQQNRFGIGECSSIAAAVVRQIPLGTDDRAARQHILRQFPTLSVFDTPSIVVELIRSGMLTLAEADQMKERWASEHRFRLTIGSFAELL